MTPSFAAYQRRLCVLIGAWSILVIGLTSSARIGVAQGSASTASICVLAFADTNKNGVRDADEGLLNGANIALFIPAASGAALIANHVSDAQGQSCFDNLTPGQYTLSFNDPLAVPTTETNITVSVIAGQQITRTFGALPMQAIIQDVNSDKVTILLTRRNRVILGLIGAGIAMLAMLGLGLIVRNGRLILIARSARQPEQIR